VRKAGSLVIEAVETQEWEIAEKGKKKEPKVTLAFKKQGLEL